MAILRYGDHGEAVKGLQRDLNKVGALLRVDGDFGPATRTALAEARVALALPGPDEADDALLERLAAEPDPCPQLTSAGATFIAREEVSSAAAYRALYSHPVLPPNESGVTIGIGYDLRFADHATFVQDWGDRLPREDVSRLSLVLARRGTAEKLALVSDIEIPLASAFAVFVGRTLPSTLYQTRAAYPQLDALPPARRTALVSLVYNRGPSLVDAPGSDRRLEMRRIRELLDEERVDEVAEQLEAMARLWPDGGGLGDRRCREAILWRSGFEALQMA